MTIIIGSGANFTITEIDGKPAAQVEAILICSRVKYISDASGLQKTYDNFDFRFTASPKALKLLAKQLHEMADEAEELEGRTKFSPEEE